MEIDELNALLAQVREKEAEGDLVTAHRLLDRADPQARRYGSFHYARGSLAFRLGDVMKAVDAFEEAARLEPEVAEFHANLGAALFEHARRTGALMERGEHASAPPDLLRAKEALETAARLSPKLASVFNNLGLVRATLGDTEGALAAFDEGLKLEPRDVHTLYNKAAALYRSDRAEACLQTLDRVLELDASFGPAKESRQKALERLSKSP